MLVTNTDTEVRQAQQNIIFDKVNAMQRVKKTHLLANNPDNPSHPLLLQLLSQLEIKHGKVANLESKQNHRN